MKNIVRKPRLVLALTGLLAATGLITASPASAWTDTRYFTGTSVANQVRISPEATNWGGKVYVSGTSVYPAWHYEYIGLYSSANDYLNGTSGDTNSWRGFSNGYGEPWSTLQCWWNSYNNYGAPDHYCNQYR